MLLSLLLQASVLGGTAAGADSTAVRQPLFESHEVLELRLATALRTVLRDIGKDRGNFDWAGETQHPATLEYAEADGRRVTLQATVETRGGSRRDPDVCRFPPLRIDLRKRRFPAGQLDGSVFENKNRIKIVTHCRDGDEFEQNLLQEYLIYRTYNLFTDMSFRVRLARVTYVDTERGDSLTGYAVFLEDEDLLAARHGSAIMDVVGINALDTDATVMTRLAVFQLMMLSTDWEVSSLRNIKLIGPLRGAVVPVPYDFDLAGVIDPPYGAPDRSLPIRTLRDRLFRGYCRSEREFDAAFQGFRERKEAIYALVTHQVGLDRSRADRLRRDYDRFYEILDDPARVNDVILRRCRQRESG